MKKKFFLLLVGSLLMALLSSCSKSAAEVIPASAQGVLVVDMKSTMLSVRDLQEDATKQLNKMIMTFPLDPESKDFLSSVLKNPKASGIDVTKPIYFALLDAKTQEGMFCGEVSDKEALEKLIKIIAIESSTELYVSPTASGMKYVDMGLALFMFNDDFFILKSYKPTTYVTDVVEETEKWFSMENSFANTSSYKHLKSEDGLIKFVVTPEVYKTLDVEDINQLFGASVDVSLLSNTSVVIALNMDEGEITCTADIEYGSDELEDLGKNNGIKEIEGTFVPYIGKNALVVAAMNVSGNELMEYYKKIGNTESALNAISDVLKIDKEAINECLSSLNGDMTFVMNTKMVTKDVPEMSMYANTTNNNLVTLLSMDSLFQSEGADQWKYPMYVKKYGGEKTEVGALFMGYKEGVSYLKTSDAVVQPFVPVDEEIDDAIFDDNLFYARLNVQELLKLEMDEKQVGIQLRNKDRNAYEMLKLIDFIDFSVLEGGTRAVFKIETIDKDKTPIALMYQMFL